MLKTKNAREHTLMDFITSLHEDIVEAMNDIDNEPSDAQYRLGVRKLAWAFFQKFELFGIQEILPDLEERDVDAWYAGRETLSK